MTTVAKACGPGRYLGVLDNWLCCRYRACSTGSTLGMDKRLKNAMKTKLEEKTWKHNSNRMKQWTTFFFLNWMETCWSCQSKKTINYEFHYIQLSCINRTWWQIRWTIHTRRKFSNRIHAICGKCQNNFTPPLRERKFLKLFLTSNWIVSMKEDLWCEYHNSILYQLSSHLFTECITISPFAGISFCC